MPLTLPPNVLSTATHRNPFVRLPSNQSIDELRSTDALNVEDGSLSTERSLLSEYNSYHIDGSPEKQLHRPIFENFSHAELRKVHTKQRYLSGRTVSLRFLAGCVVSTFLLNLGLYLYARTKSPLTRDTYLLARGQCDRIKALDTGFHVVINVLGVLVLAAVGAYIGVLSAPTREDLDKFHERGIWFEIGIPSFRNLKYVGSTRKWLCVALFLVSWPIHLIYNSIIYVHQTSTSYYYLITTQEFENGAPFSIDGVPFTYWNAAIDDESQWHAKQQKIQQMQSDALGYTILDARDCLKTYSNIYLWAFSDVILVSSDTNSSNSLLAWDHGPSSTSWLCATSGDYWDVTSPTYQENEVFCDFRYLERNPQNWTLLGHPIRECLARPANLDCSIEINPLLITTTLVTNGLLVLIILFILIVMRSSIDRALTSFGDVLASYLETEDQRSLEMCLADRRRIEHFWRVRGQAASVHITARRWNQAMSTRRFAILMLLLCGGMIAVVICLAYALYIVHWDRKLPITWAGLLKLGFGSTSISDDLEMNLQLSTTRLLVLSNTPQIFLAIVTLMTNAATVEMTQAAEYSSFSQSPKHLRVSKPVGMQRGTYMFSMPYRYAIPIQAITVALHWTISQSIVLVQVSSLSTDSINYTWKTLDLAFSPLAIVASLVMAGVLLTSVLVYSFRKLTPPMPLASSCSLALSAAVHPWQSSSSATTTPIDPDAAYRKVKWGVTHYNEDGTGHCSFTSAIQELEVFNEHAMFR